MQHAAWLSETWIPQSYDIAIPLRPMQIPYSYMEPWDASWLVRIESCVEDIVEAFVEVPPLLNIQVEHWKGILGASLA